MILLKKLEKEEQNKHRARRSKEIINASSGTNKMELLHIYPREIKTFVRTKTVNDQTLKTQSV